MLNLSKNHINLVLLSFWGYLILSLFVSVIPGLQMQKVGPLPEQVDLTHNEREGLNIYVQENCMACHTQQVRNIEMDKTWGSRPSIPSDYVFSKKRQDFWRQSPSLLGSERTGPDLTNIGQRQASDDWHLLHLYNPRLVVKESIMPSYKWLFEEKDSLKVSKDDVVLNVPLDQLSNGKNKVIATRKALNLVAYLKSLKQHELPDENTVTFIPAKTKKAESSGGGSDTSLPDGASLFVSSCATCHQQDGQGIPGAFPPLAGSKIVNDKDHRIMISIILLGYDAHPELAAMPPQGDHLSDEEIAAIANHERTSWGNNAPSITAEDVKSIRDSLMNK